MERGDDAARHPDATPTATHAGAPAVTGRAVGDGEGGGAGDVDADADGDCPGDGDGRTAAPCPHAARAKTAMNPSAHARLMSTSFNGGCGGALPPVP